MMPIDVVCPCGQNYRISDANAGRSFKCKACGQDLKASSPANSSALAGIVPAAGDELARLRRTNGLLVWLSVGAFSLSLFTAIWSFFGDRNRPALPLPAPAIHAENKQTVEAERFIVKNPDGSVAAEFGLMKEKPSVGLPAIRLYQEGKVRAELCVMSHNGVRLTLNDLNEQDRASIFVLSSKEPNGTDYSEISVTDRTPNEVIKMYCDAHGNGFLSLFDKEARTRIQLDVNPVDTPPHSVPRIMMFDKKGDVELAIPKLAPPTR